MKTIITAELDDDKKVIKKVQHIGTDMSVGYFLASEVYGIMEQYTPMETGMLYQNVIIEPFKVTYTQPYAKRMYYGDHFHFNTEMHANATSHWDKPAAIAHGAKVAEAVSKYLRSKR